ncbi:class I SAM-dependent methyltransferase [Actinophytocola sp.]|uniref:class I SAM-dependent methyltransferase n=1 Tax=Actinophytocola sp. TaxID=1872138 RepID=UPI00389AAF9D
MNSGSPVRGIPRPLVDTTLLSNAPGARDVGAAHRLYEHLISLWAPGVIEAAHDLGVFERLADGPTTSARLAADLGTDGQATRVLLDALAAYDIVRRGPGENGAVAYTLPDELRECLLPDGLFSLTGKMSYDRQLAWDAWRNLADAVRGGAVGADGSRSANGISEPHYRNLVRGLNFWAPPIVDVLSTALLDLGWSPDRRATMVDVGCGTGIYSHLLLDRFPELTAVGLDVSGIVPLARRQSERLDVAGRFDARVLDFWNEDWGEGFDLVLFVNIFHLQTPGSAQELLRRATKALADDGVVAVVDQVVTSGASQPSIQDRFAWLFAASMLATGGGDAYTAENYDEWLDNVGLRRVAMLDTPMHRVLLGGWL